jgi:hypothetical protein
MGWIPNADLVFWEGACRRTWYSRIATRRPFAEVRRKTETEEARSLWNRLLPEIERNGISGAVTYLEGEFDRIGEQLDRELARIAAND